ncbi:MAG: alpha/beta hydrolase [Deltaproteobacteria bacterium]|nr:alpha/beta hydrolase [Deltaproteobacteria bacterium]MDQ3295156.1 alpha/beta hydrolase [Myxococcota bacterium]
MATARVNGTDLYYEAVGSGPPLLMMHGTGLDHTYLRPWHDELADRSRVIYYDQRWHGRSERTGPADHATWIADAAGLLDHLGEHRATIYGHSYGAWLALAFAALHPECVSSLILCGASPAFDYADEVIARAQARNPVAASALLEGMQVGVPTDAGLQQLWHDILPLYFHGEPRSDVLAATRYSAPGFAHGMRCLEGFTMVGRLAELAMPILVLVGRDDYITPPSQAGRLAAEAPNATVVELARSGHFPFVEEPAAYVDAIRAWWRP